MSKQRLLTAIALAAILTFGGWLRLTGQNWDDFSYTHPDERFLTILLLPQIGGGNNYTDDQDRFPEQQLLVKSGSEIGSLGELRHDSSLGVISGGIGERALDWLGLGELKSSYSDFWSAERALESGAVDALLVATSNRSNSGNYQTAQTISSTELQKLRCRHLYPQTDGAGGYFDTSCSPLNPHNAGHGFYVYGTLPLFLAHFGSELLRWATDAGLPLVDFQSGHLVWRGLSALFDLLTISIVFSLGCRLHGKRVGLLAALFYACAPLAIQKAHFGTVNAATTCLVTLALYFAVRVQQRGRLLAYLLFGLACGAAVASRINVAPLAAIILPAAAIQAMPALDARLNREERLNIAIHTGLGLLLSGLGAFLAFRFFNPYAFEGPGFFGILPNPRWLANLAEVSYGVSGAQDSPPNWQWLARNPFLHAMKDMLFWAMGLGFGVLGWFGFGWSASRIMRNRPAALDHLLLVIWTGGYFLWMSRIWSLASRYYFPMYGALAVLAAWSLLALWRDAASSRRYSLASIPCFLLGSLLTAVGGYQASNGAADATAMTALLAGLLLVGSAFLPRFNHGRVIILGAFVIAFSLLWSVMFGNIYRHQSTLVQAARYLFEQVPGDFAMRVDGANADAPLINIAMPNSGVQLSGFDAPPYNRATHYQEFEPMRAHFTSQSSGRISSVYAPHLGDPLDDSAPEQVIITIYAGDGREQLAKATLFRDLPRDEHPLGSAYDIPFDQPWDVESGADYIFEIMTAPGSGDVIGSGAVVLNEGIWDNQVAGTTICQLPIGITLADDPPVRAHERPRLPRQSSPLQPGQFPRADHVLPGRQSSQVG